MCKKSEKTVTKTVAARKRHRESGTVEARYGLRADGHTVAFCRENHFRVAFVKALPRVMNDGALP